MWGGGRGKGRGRGGGGEGWEGRVEGWGEGWRGGGGWGLARVRAWFSCLPQVLFTRHPTRLWAVFTPPLPPTWRQPVFATPPLPIPPFLWIFAPSQTADARWIYSRPRCSKLKSSKNVPIQNSRPNSWLESIFPRNTTEIVISFSVSLKFNSSKLARTKRDSVKRFFALGFLH